SRALAAQIREGLARRVDQEQAAWLAEIAETLADGRVVRALRLSSRPPKAGAPLPPDLATKLAEAASAALTADTIVDRWATVLDALSFSPVRLTVAPASRPEDPSPELVAAVTRVASRTPKVAEAFGVEAPAEAPRRRGGRGGGGRKGGSGGAGAAPRPPKPPKAASTEEAPTPEADAEAVAVVETVSVEASADEVMVAESVEVVEVVAAPEPPAPGAPEAPTPMAPEAPGTEPEAPVSPAPEGSAAEPPADGSAAAEDDAPA
ncbi:MAG: hypothetical protein KF703_12130, partial [Actinobacteria bacterium]|nr:hypothetical protein [Actinomycetota bacterium]